MRAWNFTYVCEINGGLVFFFLRTNIGKNLSLSLSPKIKKCKSSNLTDFNPSSFEKNSW